MEDKVIILFVVKFVSFSCCVSLTGLPPTFRLPLVNQEVMEGNSVILHCELSKASSLVEWRRGKELLKYGDKYQVRKKELQVEMKILDLSVSDSGEYSCVCGEQATSALVTVKGDLLYNFVYMVAHF